MPTYGYRCEKCDRVFRDLNTISSRATTDCECGGKANRDMDTELSLSGGCQITTDNPRWSRSMGVPVKQLAEFRKRYPKSVYNDKGYLLVNNQKHKHKQAEERGMVALNTNGSKAWFR